MDGKSECPSTGIAEHTFRLDDWLLPNHLARSQLADPFSAKDRCCPHHSVGRNRPMERTQVRDPRSYFDDPIFMLSV